MRHGSYEYNFRLSYNRDILVRCFMRLVFAL